MLNIGDKAPAFSIPADSGGKISLDAFKGKTATLGWFVGQVMKATRGQANAQVVQEVLKKELG